MRWRGRIAALPGLVGLILVAGSVGQIPTLPAPAAAASGIHLQRILTGLNQPVYLTAPPGDLARLFIVQKGGLIRIDDRGHLLTRPFLNIAGNVSTGGEQGLLSMAFDPRYSTTGRLFVSYTNRSGDSRIVQYRVEQTHPNVANPYSGRVLVEVHQPFDNHNGGQIAFGPDGRLYMGFGDGGSEGDPNLVGQRTTGALSKILRRNVNVANPVPAVYAYGLRNPWRFSFDRSTGGLWIGDVGQDTWEEVDHLGPGTAPGVNFGWSYYEGSHVYKVQPIDRSRLAYPVAQYSHAVSSGARNCAVTGGYVYRGSAIPALVGWYLYADFCSGRIWRRNVAGGKPVLMAISGLVGNISSFGQGAAGGLYVISLGGSIFKIVG